MDLKYYILDGGSKLELVINEHTQRLPLPPVLLPVEWHRDSDTFTFTSGGDPSDEALAVELLANTIKALAAVYEADPYIILFNKVEDTWVELDPHSL